MTFLSNRKLSLLIFFTTAFCLPRNQLVAQKLTGIWKGTISTTDKAIPYELAITESDGKYSGYSYTRFNVKGTAFVAVKSITVTLNGNNITVEDDDFIYDNFPSDAPRQVRQTGSLLLNNAATHWAMTGNFKTKKTREFRSLTGTISLTKEDSTFSSAIAPALDSLSLLNALSFMQPEKPVQPVFAAVFPKPVTETGIRRTVPSSNPIAATSPAVQSKGIRKMVPEPVEVKPTAVVPATVAIVPKQSMRPPEAKSPAPVAAKPTAPPVISTVAALPPKPVKTVQTGADFSSRLAERSIETIQTLEFKTDSLVLTLYDNGEVDGDTVSVILNGKMLMEKQGLSTNAINKTIYITPDTGDSIQLVMYAENLGSLPPNTGLLIIKDGHDRYEIRFAGDLQKNAGITLRRKK